jgi:hypothetical protein
MGLLVNTTTYKKMVKQDIEWLDKMMLEYNPDSLEGKHIRNILEREIKKYDVQSTPAYDIVK